MCYFSRTRREWIKTQKSLSSGSQIHSNNNQMCKYHIIVNKSSLKTKENPETHFKETHSNLLNITVNTMALRTRCLFLAARSRQQLLQDCVGSQSQCRALLWTSKVFVVTNRAIIVSAVTQHLYVELSESSTKQSFSQTSPCFSLWLVSSPSVVPAVWGGWSSWDGAVKEHKHLQTLSHINGARVQMCSWCSLIWCLEDQWVQVHTEPL